MFNGVCGERPARVDSSVFATSSINAMSSPSIMITSAPAAAAGDATVVGARLGCSKFPFACDISDPGATVDGPGVLFPPGVDGICALARFPAFAAGEAMEGGEGDGAV